MEDALREEGELLLIPQRPCLNPCSNGRCSASALLGWIEPGQEGLNPCSNGRCSASTKAVFHLEGSPKSLNPCSNGRCSAR